MDPLITAMLVAHGNRSPRPEDRDGLAWSGLPHAPVIADRPSRGSVVRHGMATTLRWIADRIDRRGRVRPLAGSRA